MSADSHDHATVPGDEGELHRLLVESVRDYAIFALTPEGRVASWNPGAARLKGYAADEIIGRHFSTFYPPEERRPDGVSPRAEGLLARSLAEGRVEDEGWRVRKDGTRFWADVVITPIRDAAGTLVGFAKVTRDLTERRAAEARERALAAQTAARVAAEARQAELSRLNEQLHDQAAELEAQTQQLQEQAAEMEAQQAELEQQTEELQAINEELHQTNEELAAAREASERTEAHVRGILGGIGDPFVVLDAEWRFRFMNDAAVAVFARTGHTDAGALVGQSLWEAYPSLVGTGMEREMRRAHDARTLATFTEFAPGSGVWTEVRCYPMPDGGVANLWRDVTQQKKAEEAQHYLARTSEILAASLDREETADRIARLLVPRLADWTSLELRDESGGLRQAAVAHVDPAKVAWARELNERYPPDPSATTGAHEVVRTGRALLYREIPEELLVAGAQDAEHLRIMREIGFSSAIVVPLQARGRTLGALTLVSAESGRRYGEAELALAHEVASRAALAIDNAALYAAAVRAREDADRANRAKSEFLATMSHELRTPLNAIGGYVELLELEIHGPITAAQREALGRVRRSGQHLLSLINDVLNFAKLEAGRVTYDIAPMPVRDVVLDLEALVAPQLAAKALRYEADPGPSGLTALADAEKVQQVLLNLLTNAIKFTPEEGRIRVAARPEGDAILIAVSDTGVGIPADKQEAAFEPFVQLSRRDAPGQPGTGLGLAISRDLARAMNGDLTVASEPNVGSTFTLRLPGVGL